MPLVPPVPDRHRWPDLVEVARTPIPSVSPEWTDQNVSDPGIALLEAIAWQADADLYRAGRVTERHRLKLLALLGFRPRGPRAAHAVLTVRAAAGQTTLVPAGLGLTAARPGADPAQALGLTTLTPVRPTGRSLATVGVDLGSATATGYTTGWADHTADALTGTVHEALGPDPAPGAALVLGLDGALVAGAELSLHLALGPAGPDGSDGSDDEAAGPVHHDAAIVWEAYSGTVWQPLPDAAVADATRALTRAGTVRLTLAQGVPMAGLGPLPPRAWLRCRLDRGRHDIAPVIGRITVDAVPAEVSRPAVGLLAVARGVAPTGGTPQPGQVTRLALTTDEHGAVTALRLGGDEHAGPLVRILEWKAPQGADPGRLSLEAVVAGRGDGTPEQRFRVPVEGGGPVFTDTAEVWLCAPGPTAHRVTLVPDLDASGRTDPHAVLDPGTAELSFGDGRNGAVPENGTTVLVTCATSGAPGLAVGPATPVTLDAGVRNGALLGADPPEIAFSLAVPPSGAAAAEDSAAVAARVENVLWAHDRVRGALVEGRTTSLDDLDRTAVRRLPVPERAVTLGDFERIALAAPGTWVTRARAFAETDPRLPGCKAAGCVTVVVVPGLPASRPEPTPGLLRSVREVLDTRRTLGTRVFVTGPRYVDVSVAAAIAVVPDADPAATRQAVLRALDRFLHPLAGGTEGHGWRFGRDVHRAELLGVVDAVPGVAHVGALTMTTGPDRSSCVRIPVPPDAVVASGTHTVEVLPGGER
ncbi:MULTISPECIES: baseplate J/gp47 family protein [Streptomyces]|uniref:Baseplate J/gp47 family protein n=2 Tax=Streptomyces TaxID=1883 RepID=A0ABU4K1L8_9ACTN|nr:baseplate J/gp47 family protein [Streptomyces roseolus]MDX2291652.1 baseplate J/gp47 family protein [Streptomyces roseolus]